MQTGSGAKNLQNRPDVLVIWHPKNNKTSRAAKLDKIHKLLLPFSPIWTWLCCQKTPTLQLQLSTWLADNICWLLPCYGNREIKRERQKRNRLTDWQNNTLARAPRLFLHSLPWLHDYDVKILNFTFFGGRGHQKMTFFFSSSTSIQSLRIQLQRNLPTFDELGMKEMK